MPGALMGWFGSAFRCLSVYQVALGEYSLPYLKAEILVPIAPSIIFCNEPLIGTKDAGCQEIDEEFGVWLSRDFPKPKSSLSM